MLGSIGLGDQIERVKEGSVALGVSSHEASNPVKRRPISHIVQDECTVRPAGVGVCDLDRTDHQKASGCNKR